ncbi:unnamed protein product [Effrenium voratum]|nr:unnamed protein product [Effrenium voratum]
MERGLAIRPALAGGFSKEPQRETDLAAWDLFKPPPAMRPLCRAGGACAERGWGRVLVLAEEGRAAAMALQSMQKAGVVAQLLLPPVGPCAWPGLVDEGPFGVGVGLQALEVFQVPSDAAKQSTRGTAAAVAHALAVFVDGAAAAGGTIKQKQLLDDMMMGVGSSFSALRQPESAQVDAFEASLQAGLAASESDANAKGDLCVIHALACILAGCRNVPFGWACRVLLPPVLRAWEEEGDDPSRSLAVLAEAMLGSSSLARLADFLDGAFSAAGLPPLLPLDHAECPDSAATLLALCAEEAPVANQRPALVGPVSLLWGVKGTRLEPHKVI